MDVQTFMGCVPITNRVALSDEPNRGSGPKSNGNLQNTMHYDTYFKIEWILIRL